MKKLKMSLQASLIQYYLYSREIHTNTAFIQSVNFCKKIHAPLIPIYEGGVLGHLFTIVSPVAYAIVAPTTPCINPKSPGRAPATIDNGNVAQIVAERHRWEQSTATFKSYNTLYQALKKQIITVFETMYLKILNNYMVGFSNIIAQGVLDNIFISYGRITDVDLEKNLENM